MSRLPTGLALAIGVALIFTALALGAWFQIDFSQAHNGAAPSGLAWFQDVRSWLSLAAAVAGLFVSQAAFLTIVRRRQP